MYGGEGRVGDDSRRDTLNGRLCFLSKTATPLRPPLNTCCISASRSDNGPA